MLVGRTERLEHYSEAGVWFDVRPLSGEERDIAERASIDRFMQLANKAGEALASMRSDPNREKTNPFDSYDKKTVVDIGLVAWSYEDAPCDNENKARLDGETRDWLFTSIMGKSVYQRGEG